MNNRTRNGFALPTVLTASIVMLMVLVTAVSVTVAVRTTLQQSSYNNLAKAAADAGIAVAQACLRQNKDSVTWSDAKPLKPNTDCNGDVVSGASSYVASNSTYRTYFTVGKPKQTSDYDPIAAASKGYIELLRGSTATAWRIFTTDTVSALAVGADGTPTGTSIEGYWTTAPEGYLLEDGSAVSRTTYAKLFTVIGTTYGSGDGLTTFNLPDSRGRVTVAKSTDTEFNAMGKKGGEKEHTLTIAEMPSHTHVQNAHTHTQAAHNHTPSTSNYFFLAVRDGDNITANTTLRAFPATGSSAYFIYANNETIINEYNYTSTVAPAITSTTATNQNTGGGDSHNNLQPYITLNRAIKY